MKDFYIEMYNDYLLEEFDTVKLKREYYDKNLTKEFLNFYEHDKETLKFILFNDLEFKNIDKMNTEDLLSKIETKIKKKTLDVEIIFNFFDKMDRELKINKNDDFEINEDLFCLKKAFLHIYEVYYNDYIYLSD